MSQCTLPSLDVTQGKFFEKFNSSGREMTLELLEGILCCTDGFDVGCTEGSHVGCAVGCMVGPEEGCPEGCCEGCEVGCSVGLLVG